MPTLHLDKALGPLYHLVLQCAPGAALWPRHDALRLYVSSLRHHQLTIQAAGPPANATKTSLGESRPPVDPHRVIGEHSQPSFGWPRRDVKCSDRTLVRLSTILSKLGRPTIEMLRSG